MHRVQEMEEPERSQETMERERESSSPRPLAEIVATILRELKPSADAEEATGERGETADDENEEAHPASEQAPADCFPRHGSPLGEQARARAKRVKRERAKARPRRVFMPPIAFSRPP